MRYTLVVSPNVHEIRGYNRLAKLAVGKLLVILQDDDFPSVANPWLRHAHHLFEQNQKLALVGGFRGTIQGGPRTNKHGVGTSSCDAHTHARTHARTRARTDGLKTDGSACETLTPPSSSAFPPLPSPSLPSPSLLFPPLVSLVHAPVLAGMSEISTRDGFGEQFMFVTVVNIGPFVMDRAFFLASGMFNANFSCRADPGIGFDYEYAIRSW